MNNKKLIICMMICFGSYQTIYAQNITKITYSPVNGTVCPVQGTLYEVSVPSHMGGCEIDWSSTNGQHTVDNTDQRKVTVNWSDTPGVKGKLTAAFSGCDIDEDGDIDANDTKTVSMEELILSVKDQAWDTYDNSVNVDYCTTGNVYLTVPRMYVKGTGGFDEPPLTEAGYAWTLPYGWKESTTGLREYETTVNAITIVPTACAVTGQVKVEGIINDKCGSAAPSSAAIISLAGVKPGVTIGPEPGYTGASACNTNPVTFTASMNVALGCVDNYTWQFPSGWKWLNPATNLLESSPVSTTSNTIELTPGGTSADKGFFNVSVNFSCGNSINSVGGYEASYSEPYIQGPDFVCNGSATFTLKNVHDQAPVSWYVTPASLVTTSSTGTGPIADFGTVTGSGGNALINFTCESNDLSLEKGFDVGIPPVPQIMPAGPFTVEPNTTIELGVPDIAPIIEWSFFGTKDAYTYVIRSNGYADIYCDFTPTAPGTFEVKARADYGCGFGDYSIVDVTCQINKPDLIVENVSTRQTETQATITYTLTNQGNTTATAPVVSFFHSTNSTYEASSDPAIGSTTFGDLAAGASASGSKRVLLTSDYSYVILYADVDDVIDEITEVNNENYVYVRYFGVSSLPVTKKPAFTAYPIPFRNGFNINFHEKNSGDNKKPAEREILIVDAKSNQVVLAEKSTADNPVIDTAGLKPGEYVLVVLQKQKREAILIYKE